MVIVEKERLHITFVGQENIHMLSDIMAVVTPATLSFIEGKNFVTHHIPAGVFFGIRSIIGPGCVVNVEQFFKEIKELKEGGIDTDGLVFIAKNAHIITKNHI